MLDVSTVAASWEARISPLEQQRRSTRAVSVSAGPRISTGFFNPGTGRLEPGRFFAQLLVGAERSSVTPLRPTLILGAGTDFMIVKHPRAAVGDPRAVTLRLALDYRLSPGGGRNLSGYRFVIGVVFGPRLGD